MMAQRIQQQSTMALTELLEGLAPAGDSGALQVSAVAADSREVRPGSLFLALAGQRSHGLQWLDQVLDNGAVAVLYEPAPGLDVPDAPIPLIAAPGLSARAGVIASRCLGEPSRALAVIGITGTNGKTSCSWMLAAALDHEQARCGLIGTLGSGLYGELDPATHTTPAATQVQALLGRFRDAGARHAVMEVSSHALDQYRVAGVHFTRAVFTNLSRDHLDYHGDMAAYFAAKRRLFEYAELGGGVLNAADPRSPQLRAVMPEGSECIWYGQGAREQAGSEPWLEATEVRPRRDGLELSFAGAAQFSLSLPLLGRFNADNLLAVAATLYSLGYRDEALADALKRVGPVPGRMQCLGGDGQPLVIVDYAHTPAALARALEAAREHCSGELWCVFGCGGERDTGKRALMGEIARDGADRVIVTDDNPRGESPEAIVSEIIQGAGAQAKVIHDRARAITTAVAQAGANDVVLVAGKGHESWQERAGQRLAFSDVAQVRLALREVGP